MALLLFDIDGTLIRPVGIGRIAFERALVERYGRLPEERFSYEGLLDTQVAARSLGPMGIPATPAEVRALLEAYVKSLSHEEAPPPGDLRCPGFPGLLETARARGHRSALLTGNIREGASLKLRFACLHDHFGADGPASLLGAFGDEATQRADLVPLAVRRCEDTWGERFSNESVWIVGDFPRDVRAAKAAGIRCAAVATGLASRDALAKESPDLLLADLSDPAPLWAAIEDRS